MPLPNNWYPLNGEIADIGTAAVAVFTAPQAGYLREVICMLNGAITGADDVLTVSVDGVALAPTITVANAGSAAGDIDSAQYFAPVRKGSRITVANSGASTGPQKAALTLILSN